MPTDDSPTEPSEPAPPPEHALLPEADAEPEAPDFPHEPPPLLRVSDLFLETRREHVFGPFDWQLDAGTLGIVVGQQGTGRSSVLLALAGRMRGVTGEILLAAPGEPTFDGVQHPRALQQHTAIARISRLVDLERLLTVAECVDERSVTEGVHQRAGRDRFRALQNEVGVNFDPEVLVEHLSAPMRTLLTALLACLRPASYVVLDDLDSSLTATQLAWAQEQLQVLAEHGHTFIVSMLDTAIVAPGASILMLDPQPHSPEPLLPPAKHHRPGHALIESAETEDNQ